MAKLDDTLRTRLAALVADEGLELLAVEISGHGPGTVVRLVIDGPEGVSLDHCALVSRQASTVLDVEDPFSHRYSLEVSSPGLDRKMYSQEDYARFAGRRVRVRMKPSFREYRQVVGELLGLDEHGLRLCPDGQQDEVVLPLDEVFETRLEIDWSSIMSEGKNRP